MERAEIKQKIERLYEDQKSRVFVLHLIRSYYQKDFPAKLQIAPANLKLSCCITRQELTINTAWQGKSTDTILSLEAIEALREFADEREKTDQFINVAMTINKFVNRNNKPVYKRSASENNQKR